MAIDSALAAAVRTELSMVNSSPPLIERLALIVYAAYFRVLVYAADGCGRRQLGARHARSNARESAAWLRGAAAHEARRQHWLRASRENLSYSPRQQGAYSCASVRVS
jgi:hypothetical protein